ncbi:protein containing Alpha-2-macroglobulin [Rhodopirellula maiorica SM1]|uniref:Protein containing Alpha-2-macroglobulin n=2 Tax=Novipirellula TaxID=2795426 RepID=M5RUS5_9BACT|nr:protein containing Alpha-2-macroglobulin [Rhodopirellula maiorica SM1]
MLVAASIVLLDHTSAQTVPQTQELANPAAANAEITLLPDLSRGIHDAMQSRDFDLAVKRIDEALEKRSTASRDYLQYLKANALAESGRDDDAIAAFKTLERQHPDSVWVPRSRFGRAHVMVLRHQYKDAGEIYAAEAKRLLSRGRKDELAKLYLEFADRYFEGIASDDPSLAKKPDYRQALTYYSEAVKLGPSTSLRQRIEFRIARCQEELQDYQAARSAYQDFLEKHQHDESDPQSVSLVTLAEVTFRLGDVKLKLNENAEARKTWLDFLSSWKPIDAGDDTVSIDEYLARAAYEVAHTYGLPTPGSIRDLELATTAAERFLTHHPEHELASKAALEIAQGNAHHGRHTQAAKRLESLIDNPAYAESAEVAVARQMLGQQYLSQEKFDEAISAWRGFLKHHPADPHWADVQKRIVNTEFAMAGHARSQRKYGKSRDLWTTFLNQHPLDPRASQILFAFGEMKAAEATELHKQRVSKAIDDGQSAQSVDLDEPTKQLYREAISDWRRVVNKYPSTGEAANASLMIGITLEERLGKLKEALEAYKQVGNNNQASRRIRRLTSPTLQIVTERKFRSDEQPRIKLSTRNLESVTVKTYRIDMIDYFRKMHLASGIETLDIALIDPDSQFVHAIENSEPYKQVDGDIEIPVDGPSVTAVTVSSDKLEATTMVVVSDIDILVKSSRNELFLFAENMKSGKPAAGVSVLLSDGDKVFAEETTGEDGVVQSQFDELKSIQDLRVFAVHEGHMASTVTNLNGLDFAVGLTPRGYLYTDRPAYRSGQLVNIKGVVRWVDQDRYTYKPGVKFKMDVYDSRGRQLQSSEVGLGDFGTLFSNLLLPPTATPGEYRIRLHRSGSGESDRTGSLSFETTFNVSEYKLEPVQLSVVPEKQVYHRGEIIRATVELKYYYGTPLANETIRYRLGDDTAVSEAKTDDEGKLSIEFETTTFDESQPLRLRVENPQRNLSTTETVFLSTRGFEIAASTTRDVFLNARSFEALFKVSDPAGKPVQTRLNVEVFMRTVTDGRPGEKRIETHDVSSDDVDGEARVTLSLDEPGFYVIRASGIDQFENTISGEKRIRISGDKDTTRLRILTDRHHYQVGDNAAVNLHWREAPALALLTFEGASVLDYQFVSLESGDNKIELPMKSSFAPNIFLSVAVMTKNQFHTAQSGFRVSQSLKITLKPHSKQLKPGDDLTVDVIVTDPQGNPVQSELSLGLVQTNLIHTFDNVHAAIDAFFSEGIRRSATRQSTSCTFRYDPTTQNASESSLAESERIEILEREARALADLNGRRMPPAAPPGSGDATGRIVGDFAIDTEAAVGTDAMVFGGAVNRGAGDPFGVDFDADDLGAADDPFGGEMQQSEQRQYPSSQLWNSLSRRRLSIRGSVQSSPQAVTGATIPQISNGPINQSEHSFFHQSRQQDASPQLEYFDVPSIQSLNANTIVNGVTSGGKLIILKGQADMARQIRELGFQWLPTMTHAETAFWDPMVVTNEQGRATLTITMPEKSTSWQLSAKGINKDVLAGQTSSEVITKRDLFGVLKTPLAFTVGDEAKLPIEVHHAADGKRSVSVTLKTTFGDPSATDSKSVSQTQTIEIDGEGIQKLAMPVEIESSTSVTFELTVRSKGHADDVTSEVVAVRPFGFPVFETASGTASQSTVALVGLSDDQPTKSSSLEILIGPSVNRSLLESVLENSPNPLFHCGLPTASPIERAISDAMGGSALLKMIGQTRSSDTPEGQALANRVATAVTQLVSAAREQGGWSWSGNLDSQTADPYLSSRVMWALHEARRLGFAVPQATIEKGKAYLQTAFTETGSSDLERQTVILHAMAVSKCGDFSLANRLYRERNRLSLSGLVHLALTLAEMNHKEMGLEILSLINIPGGESPLSDEDRDTILPWMRNVTELQAIYLLALQEMNPNHANVAKMTESLLSARVGSRWPIEKVNGPAITAMAKWNTLANPSSEKYELTLTVNDQQLETMTIDPRKDGTRRIVVDESLLNQEQPNRIEFDLVGRATFSYSAVLTGFVSANDIENSTKQWSVRRVYEPAPKQIDGRDVPRGFGVVSGNYRSFTNPLTQLPVGKRGVVTLMPRRHYVTNRNAEKYDYLVLTEPIPAGCAVLDGSVSGQFERFEIEPGQITFYIGDRNYPSNIQYTLVGTVPGNFRAPQSILRSFYEPSQFSISEVKSLEVLDAGEVSTDEYRLTPDELYYFGKHAFEVADFDATHRYLTELIENWQIDTDNFKNATQWLFASSLKRNQHSDTVKYFEVLKEKFPDVEISFEDILSVAKSYRELGEYERSYLVYRATVQASFERESQVAGFLNERGEFVRSVQVMERLLHDYPAEAYVATATYALAQETYRRAAKASEDAKLKSAEITRVHLIDAAIKMLDHFVTTWPTDPADDQASFALATALIDLEQFEFAIDRCEKYALRYPDSRLLDSFWYMIGYCHFELKHPEAALQMCRKVAEATFPNPDTGGTRMADNRWEATYIMGQVYHSLGDAADAIAEYTKVKERFADAAEAIHFFNRKAVELDEVTTIKPDDPKKVELRFRNIAEAVVKVYRIDLMKFGLLQRNLDRITAINLAGIKPYHEATVELGDGRDFRDREKMLELPLSEEGAYLIVCRGENLYASGLILVSPLELLVQEDATSGRVRVSVKDTVGDRFLNDVHVKVIGSENKEFVSDDTDLRGLVIADDIKGSTTVIAAHQNDQYAFYRGKMDLQSAIATNRTSATSPNASAEAAPMEPFAEKPQSKGKAGLRDNLFRQNSIYQEQQQLNFEGLLNNERRGITTKEAYQ